MADFQPETLIYFARTGIDDVNKVVVKNQAELSNLCNVEGRRIGTMSLASFQRELMYVRVDHKDVPYNQLLQADTILYRNLNNDGAFWTFCNITQVEWRNPDCSFVHFKIDYFMTYQDKIDWDNTYAYIEREHVKEDWESDGGNPLFTNIGPAEDFGVAPDSPFYHWERNFDPTQVLIQSPYDDEGEAVFEGDVRGNLFTALQSLDMTAGEANSYFDKIAKSKKASINNIVGVYGIPAVWGDFIKNGGTGDLSERLPAVNKANMTTFPLEYNNAKCWSAPFVIIRLSTSDGSSVDFNPQWFGNAPDDYSLYIRASGAGGQFGGVSAAFDNRAGTFNWENWREFMVTINDLPRCPWTADGFADWQAINGFPTLVKTMSAVVGRISALVGNNMQMGQSVISGSPMGAGVGALNEVTSTVNTYNQIADIIASIQSAQASGAVASSPQSGGNLFDIAQGSWGFKVTYFTVQNYIMRSIDQFFDRFGYRVNTLKKLDRENRPIWTFIKTKECHVIPNPGLPYTAEKSVNAMFNSGVTLWRYDKYTAGQKIGDFSNAKGNRGIQGGA